MKTVLFWTRRRNDEGDTWQLVPGKDSSGVPLVCWRTFNAKFWQKYESNELYPCDELVAYQEGCRAMIAASERIASSGTGSCAKPTTYIIAAGLTRLVQFVREEVAPTREMARQIFTLCRIGGVFDVRAWLEAQPPRRTRRDPLAAREARALVHEVLKVIDREAADGFRAWLAARGNWRRAAARMGLPCGTYCRRFKIWSASFRAACGEER